MCFTTNSFQVIYFLNKNLIISCFWLMMHFNHLLVLSYNVVLELPVKHKEVKCTSFLEYTEVS